MVSRRPDGGWGWIITLSLFMTNVILDGVKYSFGIMFIELLDTFRRSKSETSWIISIQVGASLLAGPLIGALVNRFGCRRVAVAGTFMSFVGFIVSPFATSIYYLYISFGIISGLGFSMMCLPGNVSLVRYFDKKLAIACCLASTGSGMGTIVFSPLIKVLMDQYTWRGTMMIEAGIVLNGLVCAAVLRPLQPVDTTDNGEKSLACEEQYRLADISKADQHIIDDNNTSVNDTLLQKVNIEKYSSQNFEIIDKSAEDSDDMERKACNFNAKENMTASKGTPRWISLSPLINPGFMLLIAALFIIELGLYIPYTYLPDMMSMLGYQPQDAVWVLFLMGLLGTISRAGIGFVASIKCINRVWLCNSLIIISGLLLIMCPFCVSYSMFVVFGVVYGTISGSSNALKSVLIPDLFGADKIADHIGLSMLFSGVAALLGLPIAGAIFDASGSYILPFIIGGIEIAMGGVFVFLIPLVQTKNSLR